MKKVLLTVASLAATLAQAQQGIGTNNPESSSILDVHAEDKGLLIPRVTLQSIEDTTTIVAPANSLLVYNTTAASTGATAVAPGYYYWSGDQNQWIKLSTKEYTAGAGMTLTGTEFSRTGLEEVTEDGKTGWRLIGIDPDYYGNIGELAINLSHSTTNSTTYGATGYNSFAIGENTTASGYHSFASGVESIAYGIYSSTFGYKTKAMGTYSAALGKETVASGSRAVAFGDNTEASGGASASFGRFTKAETTYSMAIGFGNTETSKVTGFYNPGANRRSFVIGNGVATVVARYYSGCTRA